MPVTDLTVQLIGYDGNAFAIMGKVITALRRANYSNEFIREFQYKATSGDYDHLLATVMEYVNVE